MVSNSGTQFVDLGPIKGSRLEPLLFAVLVSIIGDAPDARSGSKEGTRSLGNRARLPGTLVTRWPATVRSTPQKALGTSSVVFWFVSAQFGPSHHPQEAHAQP